MKKYSITTKETFECYYGVEANSVEEAIDKVDQGRVEPKYREFMSMNDIDPSDVEETS